MRPRSLIKEDAIKAFSLKIITEEGIENLTIQKIAQAAGISARTIYIKYENKEDLLVKLFIDEVLTPYEKAILKDFDPEFEFAKGVQHLWLNTFKYLKSNRTSFALIQHGRSSPLLNKAYKERNIKQGEFFKPVHQFLDAHMTSGIIKKFPIDIYRALLFAPLTDLISEFFDYLDRPKQIIHEETILDCCETVIKGLLK